ncbi:MAG: glycosyltransferase 87 family protein [Chthoniobacterales bacterium]
MSHTETRSIPGRACSTLAFADKLLFCAAALVAAALKLYCAATTYGSPDVTIFCRFGAIINQFGLSQLYRIDSSFNHTPFTGHFVASMLTLASQLTPAGPHIVPRSFPFLLRLPSIVADVLALVFLIKIRTATGRPPKWSIVLFALSPVAFMVSGYHGNVDSIMVCLLVIAAYFCVNERPLWSASFLAAACSIKIVPLLLVPAFVAFWCGRNRSAALKFAVAFAVACLAVWSEALINSPRYFVANVLGYSSFPGGWGITYLAAVVARKFGAQSDPAFLESLLASVSALKLATVCCVVALAWCRRNATAPDFLNTLAYCFISFAVLAPGFIPYYLVWFAPFVLLASPRWYVVVTAASGIYLFAYYTIMNHGLPWNVSDATVRPSWSIWGTIPWAVLVGFGVSTLWAWRTRLMRRLEPAVGLEPTTC